MNLETLKKILLICASIAMFLFVNFSMQRGGIDPSQVSAAPKKAAKAKKPAGPKMFALNFKDVEINEFINMMGQLIGKYHHRRPGQGEDHHQLRPQGPSERGL